MSRRCSSLLLAALAMLPVTARAELPSFLRTENEHVQEGNAKLNRGDAKGALESYAQAARELPDAPGVHLDQGLALLKAGELAKSREAFLAATAPSAPPALRADAYRNLALAFYREGDQLAAEQKHAEAQQRFRESVDASKRSLRLRPGDPDTAWNLELAARRLREEEEKQKQQEQEQKQQEENEDQEKQPDDSQKDDGQKQDQPQDQPQDPKPQDQKQDESPKDSKGEQPQEPQKPKQDPEQPPEQPKDGSDGADQDQPEQAQEQQLPEEAEQALDALADSEENFERYRARQRATRERRAPEKDW